MLSVLADYPEGDVQIGLYRDDLQCSAIASCIDFGEWVTQGVQESAVDAGDYLLVLDSWGGNTFIPDVAVELQLALVP